MKFMSRIEVKKQKVYFAFTKDILKYCKVLDTSFSLQKNKKKKKMEFDPSIFLRVNEGNPELLNQLYEQLEELHKNPDFLFNLFQSLDSEACSNVTVMKQVLIQVRLTIKDGLNINEDFWNEAQLQEIVGFLFSLYAKVPDNFSHFITYSFDSLAGKLMHQEWFSQAVIQAMETYQADIAKSVQILTIVTFWLKSISVTFTGYNEALDAVSFDVLQRLLGNLEQLLPLVSSNQQVAEFLGLLVKSITLQFQFSYLTLQNGILDQVFEHFLPLLELENSNEDVCFLKSRILKLVKICLTKFMPKPIKTSIMESAPWVEFAAHFKADLVAPIIEACKAQMVVTPQPFIISKFLSYILYQVLMYHIDDSIISDDLFQIMISFCVLSEEEIETATENPVAFMEQNMRFKLKNQASNPRLATSEALRIILQANSYEACLPNLIPNLEEDEQNIIEAKVYLIASMAKCLLEKQSDVYEAMKKKARREKVKLPPFRHHMPLPDDIIALCESIIEADVPLYLLVSGVHLYSLIAEFANAEKGVETALTVMGSEAASTAPILVVYGSKLFCKCIKKVEDASELDFGEILRPVIDAAQDIKTNSLNQMVKTIAKKCPEAMSSYAHDVSELLVAAIHDIGVMDPSEIGKEEADQADDSLDTLFNILDPNSQNIELLSGLYESVVDPLIEVLENSTTAISPEKLFLIFGLFSVNLPSHPEECYASFMKVAEVLENEEEVFQTLVNFAMEQFVWYVYPLVAEKDSQFVHTEEFQAAVTSIAGRAIAYITEQRASEESEFSHETVPHAIFLCAAITQQYGFIPEYIEFATSELMHAIQLHNENPNLFEIEAMLVVSVLYVCFSAATHNPEVLSTLLTEDFVGFMLENLTYKNLTTYAEMKVGILFLLMMAKSGVEPAFAVAVGNIPKMMELKELEASKAQEEHNEEEEQELELPENVQDVEGADDGDEQEAGQEEEDLDDETISVIIHPYPLPFDSTNEQEALRQTIQEAPQFMESLPEEAKQIVANFLK